MSSSDLTLVHLGPLTPAQRAQLRGDEDNPNDSDNTLRWREKDHYVAFVEPDGRLVAAAGLTNAVATIAETTVPLVGIGAVIVRADRRGRGLGLAVMRSALERAASSGPDYALLFCRPDRAGLYARLGFIRVEAAVTVAQPDNGRATMNLQTMWHGLSPEAQWPRGVVVLDGLPF